MRIVIYRKGNAVIIDNQGAPVDCSDLMACIHVIEWDSDYKKGHIEYINDRFTPEIEYLANETITDFSPYEDFIKAWEVSREGMMVKEEERKAKLERINAQRLLEPLNLTFPK